MAAKILFKIPNRLGGVNRQRERDEQNNRVDHVVDGRKQRRLWVHVRRTIMSVGIGHIYHRSQNRSSPSRSFNLSVRKISFTSSVLLKER